MNEHKIIFTFPYQPLRLIPHTHHISNPYLWSSPPHESRASSHINHVFLWFQTTHSFHMSILYPTRHNHFMNHAKHTSCSIIYISLIIQSYSSKTDHSGTNRHPKTVRSRPASRSGWGVSLRRDVLAQASLPLT